MSTEHTTGRITFQEDGDANHFSMLTDDGRWWLALLANGEMTTERQHANFRRLAACWNACDGIPTEKLEKAAGDITPVFQLLTEATAEGIKLRAALEAIAAGNTDPDAMVKLAQEALAATDEVRCLGIPRNVEVWRKRMNAAKAATQEG